jgi:hypothetical protein
MNEDIREFQTEQRQRTEKLLARWGYLVEGIRDVEMRGKIAQILENQSKPMLNVMEADSNTGNLPTSVFPSRIAFPAIVQTFPALAANSLVQVQALSAPRALVLYKRYVVGAQGTSGAAQGAPATGSYLTHNGSWTTLGEGATPAKVRTKIDLLSLSVSKYMLGMQWSSELEEDAQALGGIDIQAELVSAARDEIAAEIDSMVISDLFAAAAASDVIGSNGMVTSRGGAGNVNFAFSSGFASYETPKAHEEMLLDALIDLKVKIFKASFRSPNFLVGDADSVAKLEKLSTFKAADGGFSSSGIVVPGGAQGIATSFGTATPTGAPLVGRIGQYDVYLSAVAPANKLLMGVKGAGYVLGVYRPFELTNVWYDNTTDEWIRSVRTRLARQTVDACYYGTLTFI